LYLRIDRIDLGKYLGGLPDCCFQDSEHVQEEDGSWSQIFDGLGNMVHAFPKIRMAKPSWSRTLEEPQYVVYVSDGDIAMCTGLRKGMGCGQAAINRSGVPQPIVGCGFHKLQTVSRMCDRWLTQAIADRKRGDSQYHKSGSALLDGRRHFHQIYYQLFDECIQHDDRLVGIHSWELLLRKARLIGMDTFAVHLNRFHNPVTGRQGTWGRWNNVQEGHAVEGQVGFDDVTVVYGSSSTSNGLEGRINKRLKIATGTTMSYGPLTTRAQICLTSLSRDLEEIRYSSVGDQQGECGLTFHPKQSGLIMKDTQKTGTTTCCPVHK
jgi:hypothetical protein